MLAVAERPALPGGFITIDRRIEDWDLWKSMNAEQRMVVIQLLLMANWKPGAFWYGTTKIDVDRGELAHSETEIARRAGSSRKVVRGVLAKLEADNFISRKNGPQEGQHKGRQPAVRRIRNYDSFQSADRRLGQQAGPQEGQPRANLGPIEGQPRALIEPSKPREPSKPTTADRKFPLVDAYRIRVVAVGPPGGGDWPIGDLDWPTLEAQIARVGMDAAVELARTTYATWKSKPGNNLKRSGMPLSYMVPVLAGVESPRAKLQTEAETDKSQLYPDALIARLT